MENTKSKNRNEEQVNVVVNTVTLSTSSKPAKKVWAETPSFVPKKDFFKVIRRYSFDDNGGSYEGL